jgi:hypothetical protein
VIAFEPDSLGTIDCHARSRRDDRYRLLRYGVDALSRNRTRRSTSRRRLRLGGRERMAKKLRQSGSRKVRGFMLNATHYDWTAPTSGTG